MSKESGALPPNNPSTSSGIIPSIIASPAVAPHMASHVLLGTARQGLTLVHFTAQLTHKNTRHTLNTL